MMRFFLVALLLLLFAGPAGAWTGTVLSVQDGDTITVAPAGDADCPLKIRLYGIDAPETGQPFGDEARAYLAGMLPIGGSVDIMPLDRDRYGRSVALVAYQGRVVNGQMVASGYAWVYAKYCLASMCTRWFAAQKKAAAHRVGLWAKDNPQAPWQWRRAPKENLDAYAP